MNPDIIDDYEDEVQEGRMQRRLDRQYQRQLDAHPDCRDPDHPGCEDCWEEEDDES